MCLTVLVQTPNNFDNVLWKLEKKCGREEAKTGTLDDVKLDPLKEDLSLDVNLASHWRTIYKETQYIALESLGVCLKSCVKIEIVYA